MNEFERPSYVSPSSEVDKNAVLSLIDNTQEQIDALERQKITAPEASRPSLDAKERALQAKLTELRAKLDSNMN